MPSRPVRSAGMREVAARAGVALSSVSRVLGDHPDISETMRNRVLDAAAALGYEPNMLAQSLRRGDTRTVGFVVGDISNPLFGQIALGAETALNGRGYSMLLTNSGSDPRTDARHLSLLRQRQVDGLLLSLADESEPETLAALAASPVPYVLVDRDIPGRGGSVVQSAHDEGMRQAVDHLIALGHRRIALVGGPPRVRPSRERATALRRICREAADTASATVRAGAFTAEHGEKASAELLARPGRPTAIIAGSNQILIGVLRTLKRKGVSFPADVSLVTCDDIPLAEFLDPPLATISRDPVAMGRVGAELLLELLDGATPRRASLPATFRPAASCGPPPRQ